MGISCCRRNDCGKGNEVTDVIVNRSDFKKAAADASEKYKGSLDMIGNAGTNYNDGNWYGWNGGECPVHPKSVVDVCLIYRACVEGETAEQWFWDAKRTRIRAFRVTKPYVEPPKPREFWINEYASVRSGLYESKEEADEVATSGRIRCIHVREVIEE